jgi:uncharacterized integral membrane protein
MRPSFRIEAPCSADAMMEVIAGLLERDAGEIVGLVSRRHCTLRVPPPDRRFWTPCLELTVDDRDASGNGSAETGVAVAEPTTKLWGTFSPRPEIWTACVFTFATLIILSVFAGVYGVAQLALGHTPWALIVPFVAAGLAVLVYVGALVGQGLSITEMYRMRAFVDDCLREIEERSRSASRGAARMSG